LFFMEKIPWDDFERVELRVGTVVEVDDFPEAKTPAYKLKIDFGKFGVKHSSAQIVHLYQKDELVGKQVICVTNFKPKQIANFVSEVLLTGLVMDGKCVAIAQPDRHVEDGLKLA
jgi:tRNA-binding protein